MGIDAEMFLTCGKKRTQEELDVINKQIIYLFGCNSFSLPPLEFSDRRFNPFEKFKQLIKVNHTTRYYGFDYEHGDILFFINFAEFLESEYKDIKVYYGANDKYPFVRFNKQMRESFKKQFYTNGYKFYEEMSVYYKTCDYTKKLCLQRKECPYQIKENL